MLNKVMIIGRLGRDPELRYTQGGSPVTTLNVATDESYVDRDGNKVEQTEWHRVSVFGRQAENCSTYLGKGSLVYVEGSLQTRKWQDQSGQDRYSTEIKAQRVQFLDRRGGAQGDMPEDDYDGRPQRSQGRPQGGRGGYDRGDRGDRGDYGGGRGERGERGDRGDHGGGRGENGSRRPQQGGSRRPPQRQDEDMGPAFPSEAAGGSSEMDDVPF